MPYSVSEYPTVFLTELDQLLKHGTYSGRYFVDGAEFVNNRTVKVPELTFGDGAGIADYDRFKHEGQIDLTWRTYTLGYDKEETFYVDAVDDRDTAGLMTSNAIAEWTRLKFGPYIDQQFFRSACQAAATKTVVTLTTANIKAELRKVRAKFLDHGLTAGDLYVTPETKGLLEDATNRQWASEARIGDVIGYYDGFTLIEAPFDVIGCDFLAVASGTTIRHIVKRAVSYLWAPGTHTSGDGWLAQMRWVFGDIVRENAKVGIYCNASRGLIPPEHNGSPIPNITPLTVAGKQAAATIFGHTVSTMQTGVTVVGNKIAGTLKKLTEGALPGYWGEGYFLALDFSGGDANATAHSVGLVPSEGSGFGTLDADMDASFKITDPATQRLYVISTTGDASKTTVYDLSGLKFEE